MLLILHSLGWDLHLIPWIGFNPFPLFYIWNPNWANGVRWDLILKLGFKPFLSVNKTNRADWLRSCSRAFIWSFCISYPKLANGIRWDHALCSDSDNKPNGWRLRSGFTFLHILYQWLISKQFPPQVTNQQYYLISSWSFQSKLIVVYLLTLFNISS